MESCDPFIVLTEKKIKKTSQRISVLQLIIDLKSPFTVAGLHSRLKESMDLATLYRIVNLYKENDIIREILTDNEERLYERSCIHNPVHPHLSCRVCGQIICLPEIPQNVLDSVKTLYHEHTIEDAVLQFSGICANCK